VNNNDTFDYDLEKSLELFSLFSGLPFFGANKIKTLILVKVLSFYDKPFHKKKIFTSS
jgi:hypothetical protein